MKKREILVDVQDVIGVSNMGNVFAELSKIAAYYLKFDNCKTRSNILSHAWDVKAIEVTGNSIKLDKDLPEAIWNELQLNKTKLGF